MEGENNVALCRKGKVHNYDGSFGAVDKAINFCGITGVKVLLNVLNIMGDKLLLNFGAKFQR